MVAAAPSRRRLRFARLRPLSLAALVPALLLLAPVLAVFAAAGGGDGGLWGHLVQTVMPRYAANTLLLMVGVGLLSLLFGVTTAWIVARYEFYGRAVIEWMLVLPLAVPAYIVAYVYTDFLDYAGPVQGALREAFGWRNRLDYWFPDIRSMEGAVLVMGSVLYPYVYVMARTAFQATPRSLFEAARIHGRSALGRVALPLARPAIVAGLALVLMETVSDFGTVEYFALETLTLGIFNVWLGMNDLAAAAQIASVAFVLVIAMLVLERRSRARRRHAEGGGRGAKLAPVRPGPAASLACAAFCLIPVALGFLIPVGILLAMTVRWPTLADYGTVLAVSLNSLGIASAVALIVMVAAVLMVFAATERRSRALKALVGAASTGYAFPGTILAIGVVTFAGALDRGLGSAADALGLSFGGLFAGGLGLVLFGCTVRFQAIGHGAVTSSLERLPPDVMAAGRVLGRSVPATFGRVVAPLLSPSLLAGGLLVFVDVMKELPMTLLLRPFGLETLATHIYQFAKDELLEHAAAPALFIVLAGIGPVVVINAALRRISGDRTGTR